MSLLTVFPIYYSKHAMLNINLISPTDLKTGNLALYLVSNQPGNVSPPKITCTHTHTHPSEMLQEQMLSFCPKLHIWGIVGTGKILFNLVHNEYVTNKLIKTTKFEHERQNKKK